MKDKKEKSRNPHGYWIFRWRRRWDSNPRDLAVYLISSQARYDHFDIPPCVFFTRFFLFFAVGSETTSERTDGKNYGIFNFRAREKPHGYGLCAIRNAQSLRGFRVKSAMWKLREVGAFMRKMSEVAEARKIRRFGRPRTPKRRKPLIYQESSNHSVFYPISRFFRHVGEN